MSATDPDEYLSHVECHRCGSEIENGSRYVRMNSGRVKYGELFEEPGGGVFHVECLVEWALKQRDGSNGGGVSDS